MPNNQKSSENIVWDETPQLNNITWDETPQVNVETDNSNKSILQILAENIKPKIAPKYLKGTGSFGARAAVAESLINVMDQIFQKIPTAAIPAKGYVSDKEETFKEKLARQKTPGEFVPQLPDMPIPMTGQGMYPNKPEMLRSETATELARETVNLAADLSFLPFTKMLSKTKSGVKLLTKLEKGLELSKPEINLIGSAITDLSEEAAMRIGKGLSGNKKAIEALVEEESRLLKIAKETGEQADMLKYNKVRQARQSATGELEDIDAMFEGLKPSEEAPFRTPEGQKIADQELSNKSIVFKQREANKNLAKDLNAENLAEEKALEEVKQGRLEQAVQELGEKKEVQNISQESSKLRQKLERFVEGDYEKESVKSILRKNNSISIREEYNAVKHADKRIGWWDKQSDEFNIEFMKQMEGGKVTDPELAKIGKEYRQRLDTAYEMTETLGEKINYIENYFPHIWEKPQEAERFFTNYVKKFSKNPDFGKKRTIDLIQDGLDYGLKLKYTNPEKIVLAREVAGFQHKLAKNVFNELKDAGMMKFKKGIGMPDEGFARLDSKKFDVFFPSEKGTIAAGYWEVPERAKKIIDNYLSPGLWSRQDWIGKTFRGASSVKNWLVGTKLGLSAFHGIETGVSSIATRWTLGMKELSRGNLGKFATDFARSPFEPIMGQFKGHNLVKAWKTGVAKTAEEKMFIEMVDRAGGRLDMAKQWNAGIDNQFKQMVRDFKSGGVKGYTKGVFRSVPATVEAISTPILKHYVPNLKATAFANMAEDFIKHNPMVTGIELDKKLAKIWDSVDNRFGQLVYDNLFFNKTAKDLGVFSQLSMGWNIGTYREFGGAGIDLAKVLVGKTIGKKANIITDRMLYTGAYATAFGTIGALITYGMTGEHPKSYLDYFYPRTGKINPDGSAERLQMPTMLKEAFASTEAIRKNGPIAGTALYVWHKTNPMYSMMLDLVLNRDYYNTEIVDPNAPPEEKVMQFAEYLGTQGVVPISISGYLRHKETTGEKSILPFVGFVPAPGYVTKSDLQKEIFDLYSKRAESGIKTKEEAKAYGEKRKIRKAIQANDYKTARKLFREAQLSGYIGRESSFNYYVKTAKQPSDTRIFQRLPKEDQIALIAKMSDVEKKRYAPFVHKDLLRNDPLLYKYSRYRQGSQ